MELYLNAGFGELIPPADFAQIKELGFKGVRQDVTDWASAEHVHAQAQQFAGSGLRPLFLISHKYANYHAQVEKVARAAIFAGLVRPAIELIGEPENRERSKVANPEEFAQLVREGHAIVKGINPGMKVVCGGIQTLEPARLDYLARAFDAGMPPDMTVGYHTYRTTQPASQPMPGFPDRDAEFARLRQITGLRPIWNTEVGWHDWPSCVPAFAFSCGLFKRKVHYSEQQVADFLLEEAYINKAAGAGIMVVFQHNDASADPRPYEAHFGIRRVDKSLKPSAFVPRRFV